MGFIKVKKAKDIQRALDELHTRVPIDRPGTPQEVSLEPGHWYELEDELIVWPGVTLNGNSETGTLLTGRITLHGMLQSFRHAGFISMSSFGAWPDQASMFRVISVNFSGSEEPVLRISPGGGGACRMYGCTFASTGKNVIRVEAGPQNFNMVEIVFDDSCRFEAYGSATEDARGALVDVYQPGALLTLMNRCHFLTNSGYIDYIRSYNQTVDVRFPNFMGPKWGVLPRVVQTGHGQIPVWYPAGMRTSQFEGNIAPFS